MSSVLKAAKMVGWSFLGIRKGAGHKADLESIQNPVLIPFVAIALACVFGGLVAIVAQIAAAVG